MKEDINKVVNHCISALDFNQPLAEEYDYKNVPFCVIDSVFSIGVRYEGVKNVVNKVKGYLARDTFDDDFSQLTTSSYLDIINGLSYDELADKIYNKQRTSTTNGILKAEAVSLFLKVLKKHNIEAISDIPSVYNNSGFENEIMNIKGQGTGLSLKYFYMLSGYEDLIKPDRMILRFLSNIINRELSFDSATEILVEVAKEISRVKNRKITAKQLDNIIWKYQREKTSTVRGPKDIRTTTEKPEKTNIKTSIDEIVESLIRTIDKMEGFEITEAFDDINYPIGSVLSLSVDKDKVPLTYQNMGATIIDSILQAGLNYNIVVKPRVEKFRDEYPYCKTTKDFLKIISKTSLSEIINWNDDVKLTRIKQLAEFLNRMNIQTEKDLQVWLRNSNNQARLQEIKGIKEKTTDYLKVMSGDPKSIILNLHVVDFITRYGGNFQRLPENEIKVVLANTAERLNVSLSTLDYSIWKFMSKEKNYDRNNGI